MTELETANQRIAELEARVQELGQMARDVNSRRVVELEEELAAMRAGGGLTKWRLQHHPDELPDGEVVDYPLLPGDFKDGWTEQPLYTHPSPPEGMAGWKPIADAPEDEPVLPWSEIKGGAPILDAWGRYMQYNQPQFTHFMLVRPPLASEAKEL